MTWRLGSACRQMTMVSGCRDQWTRYILNAIEGNSGLFQPGVFFFHEEAMNRIDPLASLAALCLIMLTSPGCGANRQLQSIAVTPATASAQDFSGGNVQFSAVGNYSGGSPAQGPISAIQWCASPGPGTCVSQNVKPGVTISQTGLAHCDAGSAGTWTINADSPPVQASQPGGEFGASIVVGSATLTCP